MKIRFAVSLALLLLLVQSHPALAIWGSFVSMGSTTVNSDVSCAPTSADKRYVPPAASPIPCL
jgi:hypothetical protein